MKRLGLSLALPPSSDVDIAVRTVQFSERPPVIWLTGLSGSGKSTIARHLQAELAQQGLAAVILDGDELRHGLCRDLSFLPADRSENIRRVGEVARLFRDTGMYVIAALISPFAEDRATVRERIGDGFLEVYVDTPLAVCECRDPKGLYVKAREGKIEHFTGLSSPYECPTAPEIHIDGSTGKTVKEQVATLLSALKRQGYLA
jgi:adenylyl-sulfate kinase